MIAAGAAPIDRYVVLEHLSEGGMGAIYVGKKMGAGGFEMEVVLKQLLPEFTQQEEFIDLFLREAKLSATLDHANIIHTIDLVTAGGEYFIVMEYLAGGDLRTLIKRAKKRGKRFSPSAAIYICREVLSALSYAHAKRDFNGNPLQLIHRDVSPSNILLSAAGEVKLTDFGIAKAATHTSLFYKVKGKVGYMSPEQAKSEPLDHRSDLYSLAVCLYEVLTGERLFVHAGLTTSAEEIYSQPIPQISRKVPGLTPDMDAIMSKALALTPEGRYQTAGEFQEALARCAHRNGLLMSAPELATELVSACGSFDQWRSDDEEEDFGYAKRAGTEVYDASDDEDDEDDADRASALSPPMSARIPSASRLMKPALDGKFQGVELTSIINMMDIEGAPAGSHPLVDLNEAPRLDSGPQRALDSPVAGYGSEPTTLPRRPPGGQLTQMGPGVSPLPMAALMRPPQPMRGMMGPMDSGEAVVVGAAPAPARPRPAPGDPNERTSRARIDQARTDPTGPRRRGFFQPWMLIALVLIAAGVAAGLVAMSGPNVTPSHAAPATPRVKSG